MNKQEVDQSVLDDFQELIKKANNDFKSFKQNNDISGLQHVSSIVTSNKYKTIFDVFLKNTGLYSKVQFLLNKATNSEAMDAWSMSFVSSTENKTCRFSLGKKDIDFIVPSLEEQLSLICSVDSEYFGIMYAYYLTKSNSMILETSVCINMLLTMLENKKREAA